MTDDRQSVVCQARARSPWLPFGIGGNAPVRLICLPHAGAEAGVYRAWSASLPEAIAACPVQLPGRGKRRSEPLLTSVHDVVRQLAPEVITMVRPPYAVFGHSTGALCAFELSREIRRLNGPLPVHLFVAGRPAPKVPITRTELADLTVTELTDVLRELGGTPEDVLADPAMLTLIQPMLAADFSINEAYRYYLEPRLPMPITAFAGTRDAGARPAEMAGWRDESSARYREIILEGGHFSIFDHAATVQHQIATDLAAWS